MSVADKLFLLGLLLIIAGALAIIVFNDDPTGSYDTEVEESAEKNGALKLSLPFAICLTGIVFLFAGAVAN